MMTVAPSFANSRAMANPMPVPPPVMIPTRLSNVFSGSMARDDTSGREIAFERGDQLRKVVCNGRPNGGDSDVVITVKDTIPHAGHICPPKFERLLCLFRYVPRSFANDTGAVDHGILLACIKDELLFRNVAHVGHRHA